MRQAAWLLLLMSTPLFAATYQVGPSRTYTTLNALFAAVNLGGGDIVEVAESSTAAVWWCRRPTAVRPATRS